jgi:hypothetical protein
MLLNLNLNEKTPRFPARRLCLFWIDFRMIVVIVCGGCPNLDSIKISRLAGLFASSMIAVLKTSFFT